MDPFGCHVVQKAFDCVPEEHKASMVHELLRRIPETVIHRYACHVWQKLFELRWNGEPPQIMARVNEALRGMWHEVALGETGSLVVQNIFENCLEEEKVCQGIQFLEPNELTVDSVRLSKRFWQTLIFFPMASLAIGVYSTFVSMGHRGTRTVPLITSCAPLLITAWTSLLRKWSKNV
ncbi:hypothetical protein VTN31DRAFT_1705 [Thermomyces dupontii]|uniref:uncharacterized protein n=1 Tax=Talaromyces thermophilus TaxID=28565 RepID=UPI0037429497